MANLRATNGHLLLGARVRLTDGTVGCIGASQGNGRQFTLLSRGTERAITSLEIAEIGNDKLYLNRIAKLYPHAQLVTMRSLCQ